MLLKKKIILILIFTIIFIINTLYLYAKGLEPNLKKGSLDISSWDFKIDGDLNLDGEWYYLENEFINPNNFYEIEENNTFMEVPKLLQEEYGYGTYGLTLNFDDRKNSLGLMIPRILNAHKLWINGKLVDEHGLLNDENDKNQLIVSSKLIYIDDKSEKLEIVLQVSNFNSNKGGIVDSFVIGDFYELNDKKEYKSNIDAFLFGIIFIMAIYHLILYLHYKKDSETLFFSLICITIAIRTITSREFIILKFIKINEVFLSLITNINFSVGVVACLYFTYVLFKDKSFKKFTNYFTLLSGIFIIIVLIMGNQLNLIILYFYEIFVIVAALYATYKVFRAVLNRREGSFIILAGIIIFLMVFLSDLIRSLGVIYIQSYTPVGFIILIIAQSTVIARKSIKSFYRVEHLNEKLMELDKVKDEFLANTSHELRTPLNGIVGIADSMISNKRNGISNEVCNNLKIIIKSAKRLSNLINDILDFEKLKNHDIVLNKKFVDLKLIVSNVISVSSILIKDKSVKIITEIPKEFPKVYLDEDRIHQILQNLIANSMKFTKNGHIKVKARVDNDILKIIVEDTGIGIPKNKIDSVFDSFEQVDNSVAREYGGTGLGLSIVKKLVELHEGEVLVESEFGKSTKILIKIPVIKSKIWNENVEEDTELIIDNDIENKEFDNLLSVNDNYNLEKRARILVVDDDVINLYVLLNLLKLDGYNIHTAKDGEMALDKIKKNNYDLVLLDIMMPKLSGYEVCKIIREKYTLFELPVIMITSKNMEKNILEGFSVGTNDYISKPFSKTELLARVNTLVSLKIAIEKTILNIQYVENKKLESLEVMVNSITHNIKTPIMSSAGGIRIIKRDLDIIEELIYDKSLDSKEQLTDSFEEIKDWQTRIKDNLIFMSDMISSIKFKSNEFESTKSFEIKDLLNKSILLMKFELVKKKNCLIKEFQKESLIKLNGNINYLIQILNNLIINAIEASEREADIIIGSKLDKNKIVLYVKNFNCEIKDEIKENLFMKMITTKGTKGRGIGLYLSQSIIRAKFNGEIDFKSDKSETTFYIKIPMDEVVENERKQN
jgi:signal transduction histidine kinase